MENLRAEIVQLQIDHADIEAEPTYLEEKMKNVKVDVNKLLFNYLPSDLTIGEMDAIAMAFTDCLFNPKEYLKPR